MAAAMINAMVMPLRPPKYAPMVMSTSVRAVKRNVVRKILIGLPYHYIRKDGPASFAVRFLCRGGRFAGMYALEAHGIALAVAVHANVITGEHFAVQDLQCQRILHQALDGAAQRPGAVCWVVAFAHQQLFRCRREFERDFAFG